jgi:isocitrate dehydrogenase
MAEYEHATVPDEGTRIPIDDSGHRVVPDDPVLPFIAGEGVGPDISAATKRVVEAAVERAHAGLMKTSGFASAIIDPMD